MSRPANSGALALAPAALSCVKSAMQLQHMLLFGALSRGLTYLEQPRERTKIAPKVKITRDLYPSDVLLNDYNACSLRRTCLVGWGFLWPNTWSLSASTS